MGRLEEILAKFSAKGDSIRVQGYGDGDGSYSFRIRHGFSGDLDHTLYINVAMLDGIAWLERQYERLYPNKSTFDSPHMWIVVNGHRVASMPSGSTVTLVPGDRLNA